MFRSCLVALFACACSINYVEATAQTTIPLEQAMGATFRIAGANSSGTSCLVRLPPLAGATADRHVLVTAAHVLEAMAGTECQLILRRTEPDGRFVRLEHTIPIRDNDQPRWRRHADADVAVLPVDLPAEATIQAFDLAQIADEAALAERRVHVGLSAWVAGYPAGMEGNEAGWPVLRHGTIASYPLLPLAACRTIFVNAQTFPGDSGSPVVSLDESDATDGPRLRLVGISVGMQRQTDRSVLPFEEKTMHTPLGLAIVVQAAFLLELLKPLETAADLQLIPFLSNGTTVPRRTTPSLTPAAGMRARRRLPSQGRTQAKSAATMPESRIPSNVPAPPMDRTPTETRVIAGSRSKSAPTSGPVTPAIKATGAR